MKITLLSLSLFFCSTTLALAASSNVGIGTSTPTAKLDVEGSGNVILNAGNVGVGTASPTQAMNLNSSGWTTFEIDTGNGQSQISLNASTSASLTNNFYINNQNGFIQTGVTRNSMLIFNPVNPGGSGPTQANPSTLLLGSGSGGPNSCGSGCSTGTSAPTTTVGIGYQTNMSTFAPLDVNGEVKVSKSGLACSTSTAGAMRYNSSTTNMEYCNGSAWSNIGGSGGPTWITPVQIWSVSANSGWVTVSLSSYIPTTAKSIIIYSYMTVNNSSAVLIARPNSSGSTYSASAYDTSGGSSGDYFELGTQSTLPIATSTTSIDFNATFGGGSQSAKVTLLGYY